MITISFTGSNVSMRSFLPIASRGSNSIRSNAISNPVIAFQVLQLHYLFYHIPLQALTSPMRYEYVSCISFMTKYSHWGLKVLENSMSIGSETAEAYPAQPSVIKAIAVFHPTPQVYIHLSSPHFYATGKQGTILLLKSDLPAPKPGQFKNVNA